MAPIILGLAQLAPALIRLFNGGEMAANVAEQVVGIAQTVTGTQAPDAALAALKADPAKVLEFQKAVDDREADLDKAFLMDRQDARKMQVAALAQDDLFSKRFVYYFAAGWSLFSMLYFLAVTFAELPTSGQRVADTILGVLIASVIGVMFAYFYGSTKQSAEKTRLIAQGAQVKT